MIHFGWLKTERENQPIEKDNMNHFIYYSQIYSWNKSTPGGGGLEYNSTGIIMIQY